MKSEIKTLILIYGNKLEFDVEYFVEEFIQFRILISSINDKNVTSPSDQIKCIKTFKTMQISHAFQIVEIC